MWIETHVSPSLSFWSVYTQYFDIWRFDDSAMGSAQNSERKMFSHLQLWFSININSAIVHHFHDGNTQVAPNSEGDAKAQTTHYGNDVALGQPAAVAVARCWLAGACLHRLPLFCQLNVILLYVGAIDFPKWRKKEKMKMPYCLSKICWNEDGQLRAPVSC